jgi:hypothetical protein
MLRSLKHWHRGVVARSRFSSIEVMLRNKSGLRSALIIDEALQARYRLPEWKVIYKRRGNNRVAHELAQLARCRRHSAVWCFVAPMCVEQTIA